MNVELYLLGQAFDNYQYELKHKTYNLFAQKQADKSYLINVWTISRQYHLNALYVLSACFKRHLFLNRKKVYLPYLLDSQLTMDYIKKALEGNLSYDKKRFRQYANEYKTYLNLDSIYLKAVKTVFEIGLTNAQQEAQQQYQNLVDDYLHEPYSSQQLELLRQAFLSRAKDMTTAILLLNGANCISPLVMLFTPLAEVFEQYFNDDSYIYVYSGISNVVLDELEVNNSQEQQFLMRSHYYLKQKGMLVGGKQ